MCYAPVCHFPIFDVIAIGTFDLHALDTPPAFILSQDQTLNMMSCPKTRFCLDVVITQKTIFRVTRYVWLDEIQL